MSQPVAKGQPAGGQPQPAGPAGTQRGPPQIPLYRPEQMRSIPMLSEDEKGKYEKGLSQLWSLYEKHPPGSNDQNEAKRKILEFGKMLTTKMAQRRQQYASQLQQQQQKQQQHAAGQPAGAQTQTSEGQTIQSSPQQPIGNAQQPGAAGPGQGAGATGMAPTTAAAPVASGAGPAPAAVQPAPGQPAQQPKLPDHIVQHVNQMTFLPGAGVADKTPDVIQKWQADMKARYSRALLQMEHTRAQIAKMDAQLKERAEKGNALSAEEQRTFQERRATFQKHHTEAQKWVEVFRRQQEALKAGQSGRQQNGVTAQKPLPGTQIGQNQTAIGAGGAAASNAALQNSQNAAAVVNAAFETVKNQQIAAGQTSIANGLPGQQQPQRPQVIGAAAQQQPSLVSQAPPSQPITSQQPHPQQQPQFMQQQQQQQHQPQQQAIKLEPGTQPPGPAPLPAPLNTTLASTVASGLGQVATPTQNTARVQTPQSATPTSGAPRALSHTAALSLANQSRSQPGSAPVPGVSGPGGTPSSAGVMGTTQNHPHGHSAQASAQNAGPPKLPIPKVLHEKATQLPQPVAMGGGIGSGRPTYSGGSGIGSGVMGQPAVAKTPAFQLDGEGERVLNKKKLDELVRQVCGGTAEEGQEGNLLAPEVEESVLNLADSFVDSVLSSACRNAKERGSKVLEIRDIQLVLERTYNIRIPGYSSDELRTVRKIQPSAAWISKMSAVQAAKVMPGKGDI